MNRSARTFAIVAVSLMSGMLASASCSRGTQAAPSYLFLWAGDADGKASDFLAVIDAAPASPRYGSIVASIPTGTPGTHPHHTELEMPANGHLLANGFHAGRTWLFDLTQPLRPKVITSFGELAGFSHPHTFIRLANGNLLTTFQYAARTGAPAAQPGHAHGAAATRPPLRQRRRKPVVSSRWTNAAPSFAAGRRTIPRSSTRVYIPTVSCQSPRSIARW